MLNCLKIEGFMIKDRKIIAIVQARMGSCRLPNKSMLSLRGDPLVKWVFHRVSKSRLLDGLVFAIPDVEADDSLAVFLNGLCAKVYRGSELDLIDRFYNVAKKWQATQIVRVTADCPFVSGEEIDHLIEFFNSDYYDYAYNHIPLNNLYPDGIGAEIMSWDVLNKLRQVATEQYDREHISTYIRSNPENFKIGTFDPKDTRLHFPSIRMDLDTQQDYENLSKLNVDMDMKSHEIIAEARAIGWG